MVCVRVCPCVCVCVFVLSMLCYIWYGTCNRYPKVPPRLELESPSQLNDEEVRALEIDAEMERLIKRGGGRTRKSGRGGGREGRRKAAGRETQ